MNMKRMMANNPVIVSTPRIMRRGIAVAAPQMAPIRRESRTSPSSAFAILPTTSAPITAPAIPYIMVCETVSMAG